MSTVTFAICGFGRIGKRHAKIIDTFQGAELGAIIDIQHDVSEKVLELGYSCPAYTGIKEFIENDAKASDAVVIATPNGTHAPLALEALENGYHVVIEKPMALTKKECEDIIFKALKADRQVFVVKQNRYSPTSLWLKDIVDSGTIGDIFMVQTNCYWNRDERYYTGDGWHGTGSLDGGTLFTQFSHFIDTLYWIFGDFKNIQASLHNFNHKGLIEFEDSGLVQFEFTEGGFGSINYSTSCWGGNMESSIIVIGSRGSVKVGGQYMNEVEYCRIKDYELPELPETNPPNDYGPYKGSAANHHYIIDNVVETLNGNSHISTNALEGLKVVEIIENIYKAGKGNGTDRYQ